MTDIQILNEKFGIPGILTFKKSETDFIYLTISNPYADAEIFLYGAQITTFRPKNELDILWMSPATNFEVGKAIRGGIPVCFPWFGPHKSDKGNPQHGFGRLISWNLLETAVLPGGETLIRMEIGSSVFTKSYWPHDFNAEMIFMIGSVLKVSLRVTNKSAVRFDYSCALHTYFNLSAIENISIYGLEKAHYYKHNEPGDFTQEPEAIVIDQAVDRHYYNTKITCLIVDSNYNRKIRVAKSGSNVTTVWNPWADGCSRITDMPGNAYKSFVCIESVNSFDDTIWLNPGESHEISAIIDLEV